MEKRKFEDFEVDESGQTQMDNKIKCDTVILVFSGHPQGTDMCV